MTIQGYSYLPKLKAIFAVQCILILVTQTAMAVQKDVKLCLEHVESDSLLADAQPTEDYPYAGLMIRLVRKAAENASMTLTVTRDSWQRCKAGVQEGRFSGLFPIIKTEERTSEFQFPALIGAPAQQERHLWLARYPLFTHVSASINLDSYQGKKGIAAPFGYVVFAMLEEKNMLPPFTYTPEEGLKQVASQRLDGYVVEQVIGRALIKKLGLEKDIKESASSVLDAKWFVAFSKPYYQANTHNVEGFWNAIPSVRAKLVMEVMSKE